MVLVDTSVWIDHFNKSDSKLRDLLIKGQVCIHPFIIGEIACGNIINRTEILALLKSLPVVDTATDEEVLKLIDVNKLFGKGLGFIDVHLIASSMLNNVTIWTRDKRFLKIIKELQINY